MACDPLFLMELILRITDPCSGEKLIACCLYCLKDTGFIWMTANTSGIHHSTVSKLAYNLGPELVQFPKGWWADEKENNRSWSEI